MFNFGGIIGAVIFVTSAILPSGPQCDKGLNRIC